MNREKNPLWQKFFLFGFVAFAIYSFIWSDIGVLRHHQDQDDLLKTKSEVCVLKKEISKIERQIAKLDSDKFYVQRMAREDLQMGYPDEVLYIVG